MTFPWAFLRACLSLKNILLLEDHSLLSEIMAYTIEQVYFNLGVRVHRVGSIGEFCVELKSEEYDVIISDLNLPDGGPAEMRQVFENLPAQMKSKIVIWSSESWMTLKELDFLDFKRLPKNVGPVEIKECLDVFFKKRRVGDSHSPA